MQPFATQLHLQQTRIVLVVFNHQDVYGPNHGSTSLRSSARRERWD
jgi:hypothetical protein